MNTEEYLLTLLIEECSEIIHCTSKVLRFGPMGKEDGCDLTNIRRLQMETADLFAALEMLTDSYNLPPPRRSEIDAKKNKVTTYIAKITK